jgi:hypothetical protein
VVADSTAIAADDVVRRTGRGKDNNLTVSARLIWVVYKIVVVTSCAPKNEILDCGNKIFVV